MKAVKLVDSNGLKQKHKEYDLVEMIFYSDNSDTSNYLDLEVIPVENLIKVRPTVIF